MAKNEVATTANPFSDELPSYIDQSAARGSEDVGREDVTLPRLSMIQDLSPQHKKSKDEYIEGAEAGMIFNTVTSELLGDSIFICPVYYQKEYVIWKDQNKGGGFRGAFPTENEAKSALLELDDADDCEIVDTAQHYVLLVTPVGDGFETSEAVISMSKSQMKCNRKFNAAIRLAGGDRFSRMYQLKVITDANAAGQEYYNWSVKPVGFAPEAVYNAAVETYDAIKAGEKKIDRNDTESEKPDGLTEEDMDNM